MINFNGIYLVEPLKIVDKRSKDYPESYFFAAYAFIQENIVKMRIKHNHIEFLSDFTKDDFNKEEVHCDKMYVIKNNQVYIPKQTRFSSDIVIDIITSDNCIIKF